MEGLIEKFHLDGTYFIQLAIFIIVFAVLSKVYFKPYLALFEERANRTVRDRETAKKLLEEAQAKLDQYQAQLKDARNQARSDYEQMVNESRAEEKKIIDEARTEVRSITQEALKEVDQKRKELSGSLEKEVEILAKGVSDRLLAKK